jgi:hypothetical protein
MAKINVCENTMAMFMLCEAIGSERDEWEGLEPDENGCYNINIQLNGKEINVERFLENLQKSYQEAVKKQASDLLSSEYDEIINKVHEIQESLERQNDFFDDKVFNK